MFLKRFVLIIIGVVSLALGTIGIFVPFLPTTPFVLLAAFAFANSSDRLHYWLLKHRVFGPLINNWRRYGAISHRAKVLSVASMVAILSISMLLGVKTWIIGVQFVVLSCSAAFVLTRPSPPEA
ncbi:MAG: YbaN family protein [Pseudomonadota bacterium]